MMVTIVINTSTREQTVYTCSPREAVIAAYAQSKNNWNTWQYEELYGHLPVESDLFYTIGEFYSRKEKEQDLP